MSKGNKQINELWGQRKKVCFLSRKDKRVHRSHMSDHFLSIYHLSSRASSTIILFQFPIREGDVAILQMRNQDSDKTNHKLKEQKRKDLNCCLLDTKIFCSFSSWVPLMLIRIKNQWDEWTLDLHSPDRMSTYVLPLCRVQPSFHETHCFQVLAFLTSPKPVYSLFQLRHLYLSLIRFVLSSWVTVNVMALKRKWRFFLPGVYLFLKSSSLCFQIHFQVPSG